MKSNATYKKRMSNREFIDWVEARCIEEGGCLIWQYSTGGGSKGGAPITTMMIDGKRKSVNVRREYFVAKGKTLDSGTVLVPTCRDKRCLSHLQAMTRSELNVFSASLGGRKTPAVRAAMRRIGRAKSTVIGSMEVARKIRALRAEGKTYQQISEETGVPLPRCFDVCANRGWVETATGASVFTMR